ncbi:MAG: DUF6542 domain-containing protein [Mycobacterium sp.]
MSAQRARSAVTADHRSAHPNIPGVPWWGAVLIAATLMSVGFAYDAGSGAKELTSVFAGTYVVGCIFAVLAVRQSGIFTAVIQPPLLLFGAVPTAYFVFTGSQLSNIKDTLINCAYPLIERFPLMFFTSAVVLLIGMARWYTGMSSRRGSPSTAAAEKEPSGGGLAAAVSSKISALLAGLGTDDKADKPDEPPRRRSTAERPSRSTSRTGRPASRTAPPRSRHARPPDTEYIEPVAERPRRPRPRRQAEPPIEPRRKPRSESGRRRAMPPSDRRTGYERPERRRSYDGDLPPLHGSNGNGTHHPVSRVRYRGGEDGDDGNGYAQYRRPPRNRAVESWEYDI